MRRVAVALAFAAVLGFAAASVLTTVDYYGADPFFLALALFFPLLLGALAHEIWRGNHRLWVVLVAYGLLATVNLNVGELRSFGSPYSSGAANLGQLATLLIVLLWLLAWIAALFSWEGPEAAAIRWRTDRLQRAGVALAVAAVLGFAAASVWTTVDYDGADPISLADALLIPLLLGALVHEVWRGYDRLWVVLVVTGLVATFGSLFSSGAANLGQLATLLIVLLWLLAGAAALLSWERRQAGAIRWRRILGMLIGLGLVILCQIGLFFLLMALRLSGQVYFGVWPRLLLPFVISWAVVGVGLMAGRVLAGWAALALAALVFVGLLVGTAPRTDPGDLLGLAMTAVLGFAIWLSLPALRARPGRFEVVALGVVALFAVYAVLADPGPRDPAEAYPAEVIGMVIGDARQGEEAVLRTAEGRVRVTLTDASAESGDLVLAGSDADGEWVAVLRADESSCDHGWLLPGPAIVRDDETLMPRPGGRESDPWIAIRGNPLDQFESPDGRRYPRGFCIDASGIIVGQDEWAPY